MPKLRKKLLLDQCDIDNLRESGLSDGSIRANKLRTENKALVFPYRNLAGEVNGFARTRPHKPRTFNGKPAKYLQPKGSPVRAYFAADSVVSLRNTGDDIYITEGEKKALILDQLGYAAIGLAGVNCWNKKGTCELIDDLAEIDWNDRIVYIVFDYDEKKVTRNNVDKARKKLAAALFDVGADEVYNVVLPPGNDGEKQGVDDFVVENGADDFSWLLEDVNKVIKIIPLPLARAASNRNKVIKIIPPALSDAAYHGLIGDFLSAIGPHTEATEAGILAHLLPAIGTLVGSGPHVFAGSKQPARLNVALVGPTSTGRKGTAAAPVDILLSRVNKDFFNNQCVSGLSSGEGLIEKVADKWETDKDGNRERVPTEKRLYVKEPEFSRVLANIRREGNILSQILRECYDSGNLHTLTVNPREAVGAHVSIVAHVTPEEITERLSHIEMANGFGNRFLWFYVKSNKVIAHTREFPEDAFLPLVKRLRRIRGLGSAAKRLPVSLDKQAEKLWEEHYPRLREDKPGLAGAMLARGSAMVLRLSLIYCLLDRWEDKSKAPKLSTSHLEAALAVWDYAQQSTERIFGTVGGNHLANKLLALLAEKPMSKSEINKHLSPKQKKTVEACLLDLSRSGIVRKSEKKKTTGAGRPTILWELVS